MGEVCEYAVLRAALVGHEVFCKMLIDAQCSGAGERVADGAVEGPLLLLLMEDFHTRFGELLARALVGVVRLPIGGDARY